MREMNDNEKHMVAYSLRTIRKSLHLTQDEVAKIIGVTRQTVIYAERDAKFDDDLLRNLCLVYRIRPEVLTNPPGIHAAEGAKACMSTTFDFCREMCNSIIRKDAEDLIEKAKYTDKDLKLTVDRILDNMGKAEYIRDDIYEICRIFNECMVGTLSFAILGLNENG